MLDEGAEGFLKTGVCSLSKLLFLLFFYSSILEWLSGLGMATFLDCPEAGGSQKSGTVDFVLN